MAVNSYFNNFSNPSEQNLIESLIIESIGIHGINIYYMPRVLGALDDVLNEDDLPIFDHAYTLTTYIKNVEGFEGDGDFLSKFGLQIRDSMTLTIAIKTFGEEVGAYSAQVRLLEGDLIFFPLNNKIFEIKHLEQEAIFYQFGKLQTYDIRVELFEYSNEVFNTGVAVIDSWLDSYKTTSNNTIEGIESIDLLADNLSIQTTANDIIDFSASNPFGDNNF